MSKSIKQFEAVSEVALIVSLDGKEFLGIPDAGRIYFLLDPAFAEALLMKLDDVKDQIKKAWSTFTQKGRELSVYKIDFKGTRKATMTCKAATATIMPNGDIKMSNVTCTFNDDDDGGDDDGD